MSRLRLIIEMGMGNDLHGQDYTKAAARAIEDAIRHSSLPLFETLEIPQAEMFVEVTVGVQQPGAVDCAVLVPRLPRGNASVRAVSGGMNIENPDNGNVTVIASAAVEVFVDKQSGWRLRDS